MPDYRSSTAPPAVQPLTTALKKHGRYSFSRIDDRKTYSWPEGKKLAVYIAINVEEFSFREGRGVAPTPPNGSQWVGATAWRDYGNRVGLWRILEMLEELGLVDCVEAQMNTACFEHCPGLAEELKRRGVEFVGHGYTNSEEQVSLEEDDERELLLGVRSKMKQELGVEVTGWMSPGLSESDVTVDLLAETGYDYCLDWGADDTPFYLSARNGRKDILSVPYPGDELNDLKSIILMNRTPQQFAQNIVENFDEMLQQSKTGNVPLVMAVSLHPHITGYPFKIRALRKAFTHIAAHRDQIWLTQPKNIVKVCREQEPGVVP